MLHQAHTFFFAVKIPPHYERNRELKAEQLLLSTQKWPNVQVHYTAGVALIIVGTVDSESSLVELRAKLKEIGARRTVFAVKVISKQILSNTNGDIHQ